MRRSRRWSRLWSLDLETTGLDAAHAEILAVGMVPIIDGVIRVGRSYSSLVAPSEPEPVSTELVVNVGSSDPTNARSSSGLLGMEAHHLRPRDVATAPPLATVLREILVRLHDADALLVHHAPLDVTVLRRASEATGQPWPRIPVIDTVRLIQRANRRRSLIGAPAIPTDLVGARWAFGLPPHDAHDPLADAIATAELHLALRTSSR